MAEVQGAVPLHHEEVGDSVRGSLQRDQPSAILDREFRECREDRQSEYESELPLSFVAWPEFKLPIGFVGWPDFELPLCFVGWPEFELHVGFGWPEFELPLCFVWPEFELPCCFVWPEGKQQGRQRPYYTSQVQG